MNYCGRIKKANIEHAISWKKQSHDLLSSAKNKKDFKAAVLWCGSNGNVIRSIDTEEQENFSNYVYSIKEKVLNGTFDLRDIEKKFKNKTPRSWISKICHILNPQMYPIIYDTNVCKKLKVNNINQFWDKLINKRKTSKGKSDEEIYRKEAEIWAPNK